MTQDKHRGDSAGTETPPAPGRVEEAVQTSLDAVREQGASAAERALVEILADQIATLRRDGDGDPGSDGQSRLDPGADDAGNSDPGDKGGHG